MRVDRRSERHVHTREEIVAAALAVMTEAGAGGLSLGEVARRVGMRTPSLYEYFGSKLALVDEIFRRGWEDLGFHTAPLLERALALPDDQLASDLGARLSEAATTIVAWTQAHQASAQVMFWRPIPGFVPSVESILASSVLVDQSRSLFADLVRRGLLVGDVDEMTGGWTTTVSGVVSQQLANEPEAAPGTGRFIGLIPSLTDTFLARFGIGRRRC